MKKRIIIFVAVIISILLILWIMYMIDMKQMEQNRPVVFSTWGYEYAPPELLGEIVTIEDKTEGKSCATALEKIFEDSKNEYYFNCIKSSYIIVKYSNGYEENVKDALKSGNINIADLDRFNITYITSKKENKGANSFIGTVVEKTKTYMIVEPIDGENEGKSSDKFIISYNKNDIDYVYNIGTKVKVEYTGGIMETYPARINVVSVSVVK